MSIPASDSRARRIWGETWRVLAAITVGFLIWLTLVGPGTVPGYKAGQAYALFDLLLGVVAIVLMLFRRRYPLTIAIATSVLSAFSQSAVGPAGIAMISLSTHRNWRQIAFALPPWLLSGLVFEVMHPSAASRNDQIAGVIITLLSTAFAIATGLFIGARRELVASLQERALTAEREQVLRVTQARVGERARIAREMHDVLAHRISLVAMHSGALTYRDDLPPEEIRATAGIIQQNAHQALTELRGVLGVLRTTALDDDRPPGEVEAPQPTLASLSDLTDAAAELGQEVHLEAPDNLADVPEDLSRNAYRIIQEALTNARKHAAGRPTDVRLEGEPGERLRLEVRNDLPDPDHDPDGTVVDGATGSAGLPASGLGLLGLTERAVLSGGELRYGLDRRNQWVLSADLPWPEKPAAVPN